MIDDLDYRILSEGKEMRHSISVINNKIVFTQESEWLEMHHTTDSDDAIFAVVLDKNKNELRRSSNFVNKSLPKSLIENLGQYSTVAYADIQGKKMRVGLIPITQSATHSGWFILAIPLEPISKMQNILFTIYALAFPVAMIIAYLGSSILAQKALAPIQKISDTARQIHYNNMDQRLPLPENKDEIAHLVQTMNELLDRLSDSIESVQRFTGDASHELRTPLAILYAKLEQIDKEMMSQNCAIDLFQMQEELKRMTDIIDNLTTLAKADSHQISMQIEPVWFNDIIHEEIARNQSIAKQKDIKIIAKDIPSVSIMGDEHWIGVLVTNLLDNAIKFSPRYSEILVHLFQKNGTISLQIDDAGPGVPSEATQKLTHRFHRHKPSDTIPGCGLGLAIVDWVIQAHHGSINFKNKPDRGLIVQVIFPQNLPQ